MERYSTKRPLNNVAADLALNLTSKHDATCDTAEKLPPSSSHRKSPIRPRSPSTSSDFRPIVDPASQGVATIDIEGRLTYVNARLEETLGCSPDLLVGLAALDRAHGDNVVFGQSVIDDVLIGRSGEIESRLRRDDRSALPVHVSFSPLRDEKGDFEGAFACVADRTWLNTAQKAVADSARLIVTLSSANQISLETSDDQVLLNLMCQVVADRGA